MKYIKQISTDKKRLISNFFSLAVLQGLNMLLPLITLPYLVRVLGVEKFGLVYFVLANIMFLDIFVGFGFELSATREVSIHRKNKVKISEIFCSVMTAKIILLVFSFLGLFILLLFFDSSRENTILYYTSFGLVIGNVLFPIWFFQGIEQMKYITYINLITKSIFTFLIFVLVQKESDYIYVPILNSIGAILAGLIALWIVLNKLAIKLMLPTKQLVAQQFKVSFPFFISQMSTLGSRYFAISIIGVYFGTIQVGYYTMVEKLYYAFRSLAGVISQTIYPYMSRTKNISFFKKLFPPIVLSAALFATLLIYFRVEIMYFIFNVENDILSNLFLIFFSGAIFGVMTSLLGYPILAAFGFYKDANRNAIIASIFYMVVITATVFLTDSILLIAYSLVFKEVCSFLLDIYYIRKATIWKTA